MSNGAGFVTSMILMGAGVAMLLWLTGSRGSRAVGVAGKQNRRVESPNVARIAKLGDVAAMAVAWQEVLRRDDLGVLEYRQLLDQDHEVKGALLPRLGALDTVATRLLALGRTNQEDVERIVRTHAGRDDALRVLLFGALLGRDASPEARRSVALARLATGDAMAFEQAWAASPDIFESEAQMKPWRLAAEALMRAGPASDQAKAALEGMLKSPANPEAVREALMLVAFQAGDAPRHRRLLEAHLIEDGRFLRHWIDHIELLADLNDKAAIHDILDGFGISQFTTEDVVAATTRLVRLGLFTHADRLIAKRLRVDASSADLGVLSGFIALLGEDWPRCESLAVAMRAQASTSLPLDEFSYFLQGGASLGVSNRALAELAFDRLLADKTPQPEVLLRFMNDGIRLGSGRLNKELTRQAWLVARKLQGTLGANASYWRVRSDLAGHAMQLSDMVLASRVLHGMDPRSPHAAASLVRALLFSTEGQSEALDLSAALLKEIPVLAEWRLLRAMALVAGNLPEEAKAILQPMRASAIPPGLRDMFHVAWLDVHVALNDWAAARDAVARVRRERLESLMLAKLERTAARIPIR